MECKTDVSFAFVEEARVSLAPRGSGGCRGDGSG